jgi:hypothetical protein
MTAALLHPTTAQAVAALSHVSAVKSILARILKDGDCGVSDVREYFGNIGREMFSNNPLALSEIIGMADSLSADPVEQLEDLETYYLTVDAVQIGILMQHRMAVFEDDENGSVWSPDSHEKHLGDLLEKIEDAA